MFIIHAKVLCGSLPIRLKTPVPQYREQELYLNFFWHFVDFTEDILKIVWFDLRFGVSTVEVCEIESITGLRRAGSANEK